MHYVCNLQTGCVKKPSVSLKTVGEEILFPTLNRCRARLLRAKRIFISSPLVPFLYRAKRTNNIGLLALFFCGFIWNNIVEETR